MKETNEQNNYCNNVSTKKEKEKRRRREKKTRRKPTNESWSLAGGAGDVYGDIV